MLCYHRTKWGHTKNFLLTLTHFSRDNLKTRTNGALVSFFSFLLLTACLAGLRIPAGPFQSDALLVPEHCLFDHIHNQTRCWDFDQWNRTATGACRDRGMRVKSFAMLLPCGIDVFSGVEFVCCPFKPKKGSSWTCPVSVLKFPWLCDSCSDL